MGYFLWVATGLVLAAIAARLQPQPTSLLPHLRQALVLAAVAGAILGAYGLQLPADLMGWSAPLPEGHGGDALPLGGRTVLGGLLGGWFAVEAMKRLAGIRQPTGDGFALPLAIALCCGRLGCFTAGCCGGEPCAASWWATIDAGGQPRVPVQLLEALFHGGSAVVLAIAARGNLAAGRRLAIYLSGYAVVRFLLEFWRLQPRVLLGLSWHQWLAIVLLFVAGGTWWARRTRGGSH